MTPVVMPKSLKQAVGFQPRCLKRISESPAHSAVLIPGTSGTLPSPMVTISRGAYSGRNSRKRHTPLRSRGSREQRRFHHRSFNTWGLNISGPAATSSRPPQRGHFSSALVQLQPGGTTFVTASQIHSTSSVLQGQAQDGLHHEVQAAQFTERTFHERVLACLDSHDKRQALLSDIPASATPLRC